MERLAENQCRIGEIKLKETVGEQEDVCAVTRGNKEPGGLFVGKIAELPPMTSFEWRGLVRDASKSNGRPRQNKVPVGCLSIH